MQEYLDTARVLVEHSGLTLSDLSNVLERSGVRHSGLSSRPGITPLIEEEDIKQRGFVLIPKELHDEIEAYGWHKTSPTKRSSSRPA